jgi:hypothetical protein
MCLKDATAQGPQIGRIDGEGNIQEIANSHEHLWFYTSIAIGFIVRFWGVCGSLMLKCFGGMPIFSFWTEWEIDSLRYNSYQYGQTIEELQNTVLPRKYLV